MNYNPLALIALFALLSYSCSKSNNNPKPVPTPPSDEVKIVLVSGGNQTAQIGYPLADSIYIKVTDNNVSAANYTVQFIGSGCNEDLVTNATTKNDGTASYSWTLAGTGGMQNLRAVVIQNGKRVDSLIVNATASTILSNPPRSACVPNIVNVNQYITGWAEHFASLSTGRLLACFDATTSIRYSDDEGATWNPLKGFGANHFVTNLAVTPQDGIFAATATEGIFYSADGGNTWKNVSPPDFNASGGIYDMNYTHSGKLIVLSAPTHVYVTSNNGTSWNSSTGTGLNAETGAIYLDPVELNNGDLYVVTLSSILFKSTDGGQTWTKLPNAQNEYVSSIYCDNNGLFYKAMNYSATYISTVEVSKDNGATFSNLTTYNKGNPYIVDMSVQSDGNFYFVFQSQSIYELLSGNIVNRIPAIGVTLSLGDEAYIVTKSHNLVYTTSTGITY